MDNNKASVNPKQDSQMSGNGGNKNEGNNAPVSSKENTSLIPKLDKVPASNQNNKNVKPTYRKREELFASKLELLKKDEPIMPDQMYMLKRASKHFIVQIISYDEENDNIAAYKFFHP